MRVAFLSVSSRMGGSEAVLLQILRGLSAAHRSWDLHLVVPGAGPLGQRATALGVQVTVLPMPASLLRLGEWASNGARVAFAAQLVKAAADLPAYERALSDTLSAIRPDVVHSNGFKSHVTAARVNRQAFGLVWHIHEYVGGRAITSTLLRRYAGRCAAIVANSHSVAQDVTSTLRPPVDVRTIHNAVDLDCFSPDGPASNLDALAALPAAAPGTLRVGLIGTFARWKGHETFLRGIAAVPRAVPIRAYVIGGAMYDTTGSQYSEAELRQIVADLGIADRVGFTGFLSGVDQAMRALDVVVHASTNAEPFGLVVAEAMACGRVVVTTATGGAAELVRDGVDALTYAPGGHEALAATLALAADRALRTRLGTAARETARQRFDALRFADQFAALYESAARGRRQRQA